MRADVQGYDVVIVGAGPTGLTLANILGLWGIATLIVERNAATVAEPRAVSIDDESLRTMQYIDLIDVVWPSIVAGYGSHYISPRGRCFAKVLPETREYGYPRRSAFRQPVLERQLREGLARYACVDTRFSTRVVEIRDEGADVRVALAGADATPGEVRAEYVVACDGARSGVREALGIEMTGSTYDERWLIVDLAGSTDRFRHTRVFCDPARPALALPGPSGTRRYEFMLLPGELPEVMQQEANVRGLLARHSAEDAMLEIVRRAVYHFHARLAERWRAGRIFLAGDAAHLSPPFAGQGMNSGIRDAQNLGWKLAACLRGELGPAALDSYECERLPHARALIEMAVRMGRVMMPTSRANALVVQSAFRALSLHPPARDYVMQMKYKPAPHFAAGLFVGDAGPSLCGRMLTQPTIEREDGSGVPLDDILGKGFALIEWDDGNLPLAPVRQDRTLRPSVIRVIPRDHRFVGAEAPEAVRVRDLDGTLGALFERAGVRGVVVRPDRYVAAALGRHSSALEADRLLDALARVSRAGGAHSMPAPPRALAVA